jgi:hypothetical protein
MPLCNQTMKNMEILSHVLVCFFFSLWISLLLNKMQLKGSLAIDLLSASCVTESEFSLHVSVCSPFYMYAGWFDPM